MITAIKTLLWSIIVAGSATVLVPSFLLALRFDSFRVNLSYFRFFGLIPIVAGAALYVWSAWYFTFIGQGTPAPFDPPKKLVVKGPFKYVRNPIYVFVALTLTGEAILFETAIILLYAALAVAVFHYWVVLYEEPALKRKFGDSYEKYCGQVSRWLPGFRYRAE